MAPHAELIADAEAVGNSECVKPHIDPMLANSPVHMGKFFARLFKCRMLQLIPGRREHTIGVFFVLKKSGKLRLILDTRKAKTYFRKPRASHLPPLPLGYVYCVWCCGRRFSPDGAAPASASVFSPPFY